MTESLIFNFISDCQRILNPSSKSYSAQKLTSTFQDRIKNVTHYTNLKLYLRLGLKLKKVRLIFEFYFYDHSNFL